MTNSILSLLPSLKNDLCMKQPPPPPPPPNPTDVTPFTPNNV